MAASLLRGRRSCWGLHPLVFTWARQNGFGRSIVEVLVLLSSSALTWASFLGSVLKAHVPSMRTARPNTSVATKPLH